MGGWYTLPATNIAMENPLFWWYLLGKMGMFMGYVSFREGSCYTLLGSFSCISIGQLDPFSGSRSHGLLLCDQIGGQTNLGRFGIWTSLQVQVDYPPKV